MWRKIPTLSAKFLIILIPILITSTSGFSSFYFYHKYAELKRALDHKLTSIAEINATALASSLWSFDTESTEHIIEAISINQELGCILVTDDLASVRYSWPGNDCDAAAFDGMVERPIHVQSRRLGTIRLFFLHNTVLTQIRAEILSSLGLLLFVLLGTVVTALVAHRMTIGKPLSRLIDSIRLAEDRHIRRPVAWTSADELGRVIGAYNRMLERLTAEESALRQSEERLSLAITATRSSVWDYNLVTDAYWWSPGFPAMLGYDPDECQMSRGTWEALVHPAERPMALREMQRHMSGEAPTYESVYRMRHRDGSWVWIEDKATAIRDPDGNAIRLTGTMADVTERVRARQALARERSILQAALENLDQGILMVDADLNLVVHNRRVCELLDLPSDFLSARPSFDELVHYQIERGEFDDFGPTPQPQIAAWAKNRGEAYSYKRRRPNGTVLQVHTNPLPEGGFVRTFTDITVETRSAEEMFLAMQETERAYEELKETQASLVQAEKMASLALLVAGVAHEINTPVGIAYGCATYLDSRTRVLREAFEKGAMKKSDLSTYVAHASESSRLILTNLTRASELIQSFKRVAVDQTSAERRTFGLKDYLEEIITSLRPRLKGLQHRIALECPESLMVNSYPGALSQVMTNLVINALVHAFEEEQTGHIAITVILDDDDIEIRFQDDGRGIPPESLDKIFEPFFTTRRGAGGSGLGLHIVFNLVTQSLGGRITCESTEGQGTLFTLRIPQTAPTKA
ncbi:MAG TPA: PAS-domain containing protein [Azospirillaceae bacterium]|nr:PAS-domain containing protein [Azospirillaceae bacterium]